MAAQMRSYRGADPINTATCTLFFEKPTDRAEVCTNDARFPEEPTSFVPHAHAELVVIARPGKEAPG